QIEGLLRHAVTREVERVRGDACRERLPHFGRRPEEAIRWHEALERLVRPLKVVVIDPEADPPPAVREVPEDGRLHALAPERSPEALDLSECLWVSRRRDDLLD